jgi:AcrR family transcriptional regulator
MTSRKPEQQPEPKRATRDRGATERAILAAVGEVLARDGFAAVGVNAIAKQAGVDKVLIYRYFGGLPELLQAWGASGRFWPDLDELVGSDRAAFMSLPAAERYALFIEHFIDALRARPLTIEILAAEILQRNELSAILETEREQWGEQASVLLASGPEFEARPEMHGLTILLIAGVQYLLVRSRTIRIFGGIDIREDAGWNVLKQSARALGQTLLSEGATGATRAKGH